MEKFCLLFIVLNISLLSNPGSGKEIHFISQPSDLSREQTYCWQLGNPYRPIIPLDGQWEYRIKEKDLFKKVVLPASCDYCGEITFQRTFFPDSSLRNHSFRLVCYGINYYCMIFINNKLIGSHSGGYSSFVLDIADGLIVINQKNRIEIKVDTRLDSKNTIPHQFQPDGLKETAGIFRSIYFLAIPEFSIEDVNFNYQLTRDLSECDFQISLNLKDRLDHISDQAKQYSPRPSFHYYIELSLKKQNKSIFQEKRDIQVTSYELTRAITTNFKFNQPQLWSPESPILYSLKIQLLQGIQIIDQSDWQVGIKRIDFQNGQIYLNGQKLILKGINWCEDYLIDDALIDRNQLINDLEMVIQLHANAIRVLNHPAHPLVTALCDSLGLFLLQEIPLNWIPTTHLSSDNFRNHGIEYLSEIVTRDQAHVSVFAWGLGGQFLLHDSLHLSFIKQASNTVVNINKSPIYIWNTPPLLVGDVDANVIVASSLFDLKKDQLQAALSQWVNSNKDRINLILSYGAPQPGISNDNDKQAVFEAYQVKQIIDSWRMIANFAEIDGYFLTALSDYRGNYPSTVFRHGVHNYLRPVGLTDYQRKKRAAFETVQTLYQVGKFHYNPSVELKTEQPAIFPVVGLGTVLMFLFMLNNRRYFRQNLKRIFVHPHGFYVDIRDGRKIPASHTIFMALFISIGFGLVLASLLCFFKTQFQIDQLLTVLFPNPKLKTYLCQLSWQPEWSIPIFSGVAFIMFVLMAFYLKFIALITRKRFSFIQSLIIPFWIGGNFIFLIPLGLVLFRVIQYEKLIFPAFIILLLLGIWYFFRTIKGMRVIYIWTVPHVFIVLTITIIAVMAAVLYYYQSHYALIDYLKFYYQIYGNKIFTTRI